MAAHACWHRRWHAGRVCWPRSASVPANLQPDGVLGDGLGRWCLHRSIGINGGAAAPVGGTALVTAEPAPLRVIFMRGVLSDLYASEGYAGVRC